METLRIVLIVLFYLIAIPLIILCLIQAKEEEQGQVINEGGSGSYYGQNKTDTKEAKIDTAIKVLFGLFIIIVIALRFV